ncbi:imidazolonepropionase-like amidohydrolase [Jatrophihabitans sp. GAS493]|uniref:amidohydrolase family protein n=1 Tax=Jatrophihabitans sp. GAS493 TaxID=1907575 RepID=UPI000BB8C24C|nr:amidohydrolase family protein [Jatrophihabitans sp. GAS493]SOD74304.1 imidazolonepropionase-like amidohydrolase [Jatrophihabitans sp. GAS493]
MAGRTSPERRGLRTRAAASSVERLFGSVVAARMQRFQRRTRRPTSVGESLAGGATLLGRIWAGGASEPFDGALIIDSSGRISYLGPVGSQILDTDLPVIGGGETWIGPAVCDAHVHLPDDPTVLHTLTRSGVLGLRDLGSSAARAARLRTGRRDPTPALPFVSASGPMLTAPDGFPGESRGAHPAAQYVHSAGHAQQLVRRCAAEGADVIKVILDRGDGSDGFAVLSPTILEAIVQAAHATGLAVVAHALRADMVTRAVDAGVDELAHTPTERLSEELIDRIAAAGISVVSTLQSFFSAGKGREAAANAAALHRAGVRLRYGTDFGLRPGAPIGVDPRELDRLADAGLGRLGALRSATEFAAQAPGMRMRSGLLRVGEPAALVMLGADPIVEPGAWRAPLAVLADARLIEN